MDETFLAGQELDKRAELHEPGDSSLEHLADRKVAGDAVDDLHCLLSGFLVGSGDVDLAGLFDVDLHAGNFDDLVDRLAAAADNVADLVSRNLHREHLRRVLGQFLSGLGDAGQNDFVENLHTAFAGELERLPDDLVGETLDLDVDLDGRDTLFGARDLEVHVAEEVFDALDVHEGDEVVLVVRVGDETAGNARDRSLDRNARSHERECRTADAALGGRTVGHENLGNESQRVGELFLGGNDRNECALRECAVTDLSSAG